MNRTSIDWADMTWNPVTGCRHGCPYCYAALTAKRFGGFDTGRARCRPDGLKILDEPERAELPRNIFVCSMADLFGRWVPTEWIVQVIDACVAAPQHNYLFLTKNPQRYLELDKLAILPRKGNFWYGSTVTNENTPYFYSDKHNTFLSVEPMQGPMHGTGTLATDWVIVGAETGHRPGKTTPKKEWVLDLAEECEHAGVPIFMKQNLVTEGVLTRGEIIRRKPAGMTFA